MGKPPLPTESELEILHVLWEHGPSTVRAVHERVRSARDVGYTTVLKLLQIMHDKGLVRRDTTERSHVYEARHGRDGTQRALVKDLLQRAFQGSATALVQRALEASPADAVELAEIKRLVKEHGE
jgi:predicted transcriptional regulator